MKYIFRLNLLVLALLVVMTLLVSLGVTRAEVGKPTAAQDIQQAQNYLQNLGTVEANFIQRAHNGVRMSGTFYLNRPGKLRFDYNEIDDFIVADGVFIYFYDAELQEQTNAPIGQTLADFLLREDLSLTKDLTVTKIKHDKSTKQMTLNEKGDENAGNVTLFFSKEPYELIKWHVTDAAGLTTEILLQNMKRDIELSPALFRYFKPKQDNPTYN